MWRLLLVSPAYAVIYLGSPETDAFCAFVSRDDPTTTTDEYGDYIAGDTSHPYALVTVECNRWWADLQFGPDVQPGANWKRRIYVVTEGPGVEDEALCRVFWDDVEQLRFEIFAYL